MAVTTSLRRSLVRLGVVPAWVALALVALPFLAGVALSPVVRYLPFALSLVLFGLPHGATDHVALARLGASRPLATTATLYAVGIVATLAAWLLAPTATFVGFVLLTWYHWGQGDLAFLFALGRGDHLRSRLQRALTLAVRGGLPMVVPLVGFPATYRAVARATVSLFDPSVGAQSALAGLFHSRFRLAAGGLLLALSAFALALGYVSARETGHLGDWRFDAVETTLLWAYFLVVPPVLAIGLYFCLWHSVRHIVRVLILDETSASALAAGRFGPPFSTFARQALPNTVVALLLFGGLAVAVPPSENFTSLLGLYLVLLAALTVPHTVVVSWMDVRQRVWSP